MRAKNRREHMGSLSQVLSTKHEKLKTQVLSTSPMTSVQIRNRVLMIADGLTSVDRDFTSWYCKAYKVLGEGKFAAVASMARQPGVANPRTLFGHLLKQEMDAQKR